MVTIDPLNSSVNLATIAQQSKQASLALVEMGAERRSDILKHLSSLVAERKDDILEANTLDLEASREMAVPDLMLDWLRLTPERIQNLVNILRGLADAPDPLQELLDGHYPILNAHSYGHRMPLGVIALVYESFPEFGTITAGLCLKSGNALILKGGSEASYSNQALTRIIHEVLANRAAPVDCIHLLPTDQNDITRDLITLTPHIQLLIPYGRPNLIQRVIKRATVPVLPTSIGNCCLYCAKDAPIDMVLHMITDSSKGEPDAVNAIDKVLIHQDYPEHRVIQLVETLREQNYTILGDQGLSERFGLDQADLNDWSQSFVGNVVLCKYIESGQDAIQWINQYSATHASCIATHSLSESTLFRQQIMCATVYINVSPRFHRYPSGGAISLGMSVANSQGGGPIMAHHLTAPKRIAYGEFV